VLSLISSNATIGIVRTPGFCSRFASIAIFYGWLGANDRQFIYGKNAPYKVYSVDHGHFFPNGEDIFGVSVRGFRSIKKFLSTPRALRAIRNFNLTHMNRGRNAYQASHCYSLADYMVEDGAVGA
jgi:hypothetical protein